MKPRGPSKPDQARENDTWPRFTAISYDGETIDADDSLDTLLASLDRAADARQGREELTVWERGERVVGVLKADGRIFRLDGPEPERVKRVADPEPEQAAPSPKKRRKAEESPVA